MRWPPFNIPPVIGPLLRSRPACLGVLITGAIQISLTLFNFPGWQCPMRVTLHLPCPGCGLTRAVAFCLRGDWQTGLQYHVFAPVVMAFLLTLLGCAILPTISRLKIISGIEVLERRFGLAALLLAGMLVYWLLRLLLWREAFVRLVV